jgi:hypothetical protein
MSLPPHHNPDRRRDAICPATGALTRSIISLWKLLAFGRKLFKFGFSRVYPRPSVLKDFAFHRILYVSVANGNQPLMRSGPAS